MRHFTIQLIDGNRQTRQWAMWANTLTVGSDPRSSLVLPRPMPARIGAFHADAVVDLPIGRLIVTEDTPLRERLWAGARERIAKSRLLAWAEPGQKGRNARAGVMAGLGAMFFFAVGAMVLEGQHPKVADDSPLPATIIDLVAEDKVKPEEKKPVPDVVELPEQTEAQNKIPDPNPNQNGPTETRTVAQAEKTPAAVMKNSVMDRLTTMTDGALGEAVDPNAANMVDVILAGNGGHLKQGPRGGMGAGEGDRLAAVGGYGLGTGIGNGIGTDPRATGNKIKMGLSNVGAPVKKAVIHAPTPSEIVFGGEAGSRSPESILRVIRQHIGGFRYSYEKALKENPDIGGKISLKFTIAPDGTVTAIEVVSSTTGVAALDDEIKGRARGMRFDSIERGNVTVTYAFVLDRQ